MGTPSSEKQENIFLCALGGLARKDFLKWFCQTFRAKESKLNLNLSLSLPSLSGYLAFDRDFAAKNESTSAIFR
jgi:hypothetical protein